ncbi:MAG: copper chaperone PCu(A)C [Pseudomonadota bacterium]|nr:copper chaperone PCu(A)C [Pseudomonadota bacterium]
MVRCLGVVVRCAALLLLIDTGQSAALAADYRAGDLLLRQPWSRPTPPTASVGVVYFSIDNRGRRADRLVGISSPVAGRVEIHETRMQQGSVEMRALASLECPPGVTVKSEPGGLHIMLVGLRHPLVTGTKFPLSLRFRDAGVMEVQVPVGNPE